MTLGIILTITTLFFITLSFVLVAVAKKWDKENPLAEQEDENEYQLLQKELADILFIDAGELHPGQLSMITRNAATFVINRNMAFYRNGFENGMKASEKEYSEQEVIDFTQSMISQYKFGNTNIEQYNLLIESLHCKKYKNDQTTT